MKSSVDSARDEGHTEWMRHAKMEGREKKEAEKDGVGTSQHGKCTTSTRIASSRGEREREKSKTVFPGKHGFMTPRPVSLCVIVY